MKTQCKIFFPTKIEVSMTNSIQTFICWFQKTENSSPMGEKLILPVMSEVVRTMKKLLLSTSTVQNTEKYSASK